MKKLLTSVLCSSLWFASSRSFSQDWQDSQNCHINARTADSRFGGRTEVIDATFKWLCQIGPVGGNQCTAVMMNRDTDQDALGYYFSTAWHCLRNDGNTVNWDEEHYFVFHYQSPTAASDDTPASNQAQDWYEQSTELYPVFPDRGYEYLHRSKVELVKESAMGDYALLRMVTPPPYHFNPYYVGWHPSSAGIPANGIIVNPCGQWHGYVLPNHPSGDIKKINGAASIQNITAPTYVVCDVVTTIIDVLFGWIWGNSSSTQVICNYLDNPWYTAEWCDHGIEGGSSGSPLFNANNRYIGPLSGIGNPCSGWVPTSIGKFKNVYPFAAIKNTLNPSNDVGIDLWGINGRRISCYTNLVLPGGHQQTTYYFPANHYQSENRIQLRAQESITVVAPITVLSGAHYEFLAGNFIDINAVNAASAQINVHAGATIDIRPEGCTKSAPAAQTEAPAFAFQRLPQRLEWKPEEPKADAPDTGFLLLKPNPTTGTTLLVTDLTGPLQVSLMSATGQLMQDAIIHDAQVDVSALPAGMYLMRAVSVRGELRTARLVRE